MSVVDEFRKANDAYASSFQKGDLPMPPARHVAVLTCMDARLQPSHFLGLELGHSLLELRELAGDVFHVLLDQIHADGSLGLAVRSLLDLLILHRWQGAVHAGASTEAPAVAC